MNRILNFLRVNDENNLEYKSDLCDLSDLSDLSDIFDGNVDKQDKFKKDNIENDYIITHDSDLLKNENDKLLKDINKKNDELLKKNNEIIYLNSIINNKKEKSNIKRSKSYNSFFIDNNLLSSYIFSNNVLPSDTNNFNNNNLIKKIKNKEIKFCILISILSIGILNLKVWIKNHVLFY